MLSELIKKGGLAAKMTVTPATSATPRAACPVSVAPVATVAVAEPLQPAPDMSANEEFSIRRWLAHIEETDPDMIAEVVDNCRNNLEARCFYLKRAEVVAMPTTTSQSVQCGICRHFHRTGHPHLGHCREGELEAIAGLWDTDPRECERFLPHEKHANDD